MAVVSAPGKIMFIDVFAVSRRVRVSIQTPDGTDASTARASVDISSTLLRRSKTTQRLKVFCYKVRGKTGVAAFYFGRRKQLERGKAKLIVLFKPDGLNVGNACVQYSRHRFHHFIILPTEF